MGSSLTLRYPDADSSTNPDTDSKQLAVYINVLKLSLQIHFSRVNHCYDTTNAMKRVNPEKIELLEAHHLHHANTLGWHNSFGHKVFSHFIKFLNALNRMFTFKNFCFVPKNLIRIIFSGIFYGATVI